MSAEREFVLDLVRSAGEILRRGLGRLGQIEKKGARDLVTATDREVEAFVIERLNANYPEDSVLAEETQPDVRSEGRLWILDPLDGTTNFVYGIPHFALSLALYERGSGRIGVVYNPLLEELYIAEASAGASKNGRPIGVRGETELSEALLCTGFHYRLDEKSDSNLEHWTRLATRTRGLRRLGSAALDLCYVAEGRYDGFWELHLSPWDVAAGALIAREAGAQVTDFSGGDAWLFGGEIVAANPGLSERLRVELRATR